MRKQKKSRPAESAPAEQRRAIPAWAWPLILAGLVLVFYWTPLTSSSASIQWDAADMHYPLQKYFADHARSGHLPFWTPYLFSGYPFLANPEVAAWYVPHWVFFLAGVTPRAIQMELALNAFLACLGAFLFLGALVKTRSAALAGALAYGLSGFFAGHASHVGLFSAAAGLPWLLLAYRRAYDCDALRYGALGGLAGGMIVLAGYAQIAMYAYLALALYAVSDIWREPKRWMRTAAIVGGMLAGALGVAAIQILPGLELTAHSIRAAQNYSHNAESVLDVRALATLLFPDALGAINGPYTGPFDITQYYFYAGLLLVPLAVLGAVKSRLRIPALIVIIPWAWYMLGPSAGLYRLGALVPGLHKVRAPIQGWFVIALALAMLAAAGMEWVLERWPVRYLGAILVALLFVDVCYWNSWNNPLAYAHSSFEELYGAHEEIGRQHVKPEQPPLTRFDMPRQIGVLGPLDHPLDLQLEATYGYFSVELSAYDQYTEAMPRNPKLRNGLNIARALNTATGQMETNATALPRFFFPQAATDVHSEDESRRALDTLDPAATGLILGSHDPIQQDASATASILAHDEQSYRVRYHAASPSLLVFSMAWFPGWHASVNGKDAPALRVDHALMGAVVPAGDGEVEFRYQSNYFTAGAALSLLSSLGLAALWILRQRRPGGK